MRSKVLLPFRKVRISPGKIMARPRRCVIPQWPHHVVQRGIRKQPTFYEDRDFLVYIRVLRSASRQYNLRIIAYTLMTNHPHLIVVPHDESCISSVLHQAHTEYSTYFNNKYGFKGHVWEGRPKMFPMHESYMWNAIRYVERNPVRARLVERAEDYLWSSAAAHCGLRDDLLLDNDFLDKDVIPDWSEWLRVEQSQEELKTIRRFTSTGRPWAQPELLKQLEAISGRKMIPGRPGRRRKQDGNDEPRLF